MDRRGFLAVASAAVASGFVPNAIPATAQSTGGTLRTNVPISSEILGRDVPCTVYLPAEHPQVTSSPIVYLLHGGGADDRSAWARFGDIKKTLDELITDERLPPTVVVTPDARRDPSVPADEQIGTYYMNDAYGPLRYEDMFMRELIPQVEDMYNAGGSPERRGIAGYSMGGFGAMSFAMLHPGTFAGVAGLSTAHRTDEQLINMSMAEYNRRFAHAWGADLEGAARLNEHCRHYNLVDMVRRFPLEDLRRTEYFFDVGESDVEFRTSNEELRLALVDKGVEHEFTARPGHHDWEFWRVGVVGALEFLAARMAGEATLFGA